MSFGKTAISALLCFTVLLPIAVIVRAATGTKSRDVLQLTITFEAPYTCRINVGDESFLMPEQDDALLAALKPLAKK